MVEQEATSRPKGGNISSIQPDRLMQDEIINRTQIRLKYRSLRFLSMFFYAHMEPVRSVTMWVCYNRSAYSRSKTPEAYVRR